jgi:hypothetical protein
MIRDDSGDLARRALWLAGGCAALGAVLVLRTVGFTAIPHWAAWCMLVLSLFIVPAAIETGYYNLDLTFGGLSLVASIIGLLLFLIGWLTGEGRGELLDLGPIFAFVGFATGAVSNSIMWWDVLQDLKELAKEARDPQLAADLAAGVPLRKCPQCAKQIPAYAQACRYCKAILAKM